MREVSGMVERVELKELAQAVASCGVKAKLLGLDVVVDYVDMAFEEVVRAFREMERDEAVKETEGGGESEGVL